MSHRPGRTHGRRLEASGARARKRAAAEVNGYAARLRESGGWRQLHPHRNHAAAALDLPDGRVIPGGS